MQKRSIKILYFLGSEDKFMANARHFLCNLTKSISNPNGLEVFQTYTNECPLCAAGSHALRILGDVFSLEKPRITPITLRKDDAPLGLSKFVNEFRSDGKINILRTSYKENSPKQKHEIFFDMVELLENINLKKFQNLEENLIDISANIYRQVPSILSTCLILGQKSLLVSFWRASPN
jgi:phenylalanyl-tRNA synthetase alpha subunit